MNMFEIVRCLKNDVPVLLILDKMVFTLILLALENFYVDCKKLNVDTFIDFHSSR